MRLKSLIELCNEVGPDGFTIMLLSPDVSPSECVDGLMHIDKTGASLIATASAKPYIAPTQLDRINFPFACVDVDQEDKEGWPKWMGFAAGVLPTLQGRHLGSLLVEVTINEIKSRASASLSCATQTQICQNGVDSTRFRETPNNEGKVAKRKVMYILSVSQGINKKLITKQGFVKVGVRRFEPGFMGSRNSFSFADMILWIDLDDDPEVKKEKKPGISNRREDSKIRPKL